MNWQDEDINEEKIQNPKAILLLFLLFMALLGAVLYGIANVSC